MKRKWRGVVMVTLAGLLLAFTVRHVHSHGGDTSLVHACVRTNTGAIRIVSATTTCAANETAIDWAALTRFTNLEGSVAALRGRVTTLESAVAVLQAQVAALTDSIRVVSARLSKALSQSIPHRTDGGPDFFTPVTFPSARWDTDRMYDNSTTTNSSRLTVRTPGTYHIWGNVEWAPNTNGTRFLGIKLDGNINIAQVSQDPVRDPTFGSTAQSVSTLWQLAAGQYVELVVRQTSGAPLDIGYSPIYSLEFGIVRVGSF